MADLENEFVQELTRQAAKRGLVATRMDCMAQDAVLAKVCDPDGRERHVTASGWEIRHTQPQPPPKVTAMADLVERRLDHALTIAAD